MVSLLLEFINAKYDREKRHITEWFSAMLADEYVFIDISLSAAVRAEQLLSALLHNFNISFSIGFCPGLKEHRISAQQKDSVLAGICENTLIKPTVAYLFFTK